MLKYCELKKNVTKVLLPNGCTGVVTEISEIKTMKGGLLRGRDKVKVAYVTKTGSTEAWFQLRQLQTFKLVVKQVNTDIQPVEQGKEDWKSPDTFNGNEIVKASGKTEEVIVPDQSINELFTVDESSKVKAFIEKNKDVVTQEEFDDLNRESTEAIEDAIKEAGEKSVDLIDKGFEDNKSVEQYDANVRADNREDNNESD